MPIEKNSDYLDLHYSWLNGATSLRPKFGYFNGYISNFRYTVGQVLYTGNFTPPTSELTTSSVGTSGSNVATSITGDVRVLLFTGNSVTTNYGSVSNGNFSTVGNLLPTFIPSNLTYTTEWFQTADRYRIYERPLEFIDKIDIGDRITIRDSDTGFVSNVIVTAVDDNNITFNIPDNFPIDRIGGMTIASNSLFVNPQKQYKPFSVRDRSTLLKTLYNSTKKENTNTVKISTVLNTSGLSTENRGKVDLLSYIDNPIVNGTTGDFMLPIIAQTSNVTSFAPYNAVFDQLYESDFPSTSFFLTPTNTSANIGTSGRYSFRVFSDANIQVTMWGGGGGNSFSTSAPLPNGAGGGGGFATGFVRAVANRTYFLVVGGGGRIGSNANLVIGGAGPGGSGGSGDPQITGNPIPGFFYGGTGGGYTGLFANTFAQSSAILMAGGGGGASSQFGGGGGGSEGGIGYYTNSPWWMTEAGGGGTQTAGGAAGVSTNSSGTAGSALQGGGSADMGPAGGYAGDRIGGGGGGGGYFGGGGGATGGMDGGHGSGGGGSGYINANVVTLGNLTAAYRANVARPEDTRRGGSGSSNVDGRVVLNVVQFFSNVSANVRVLSFPLQDVVPFPINSNIRIYDSQSRVKVEARVIAADRGSVSVLESSIPTIQRGSSFYFVESANASLYSTSLVNQSSTNLDIPRNRLWYQINWPNRYSSNPIPVIGATEKTSFSANLGKMSTFANVPNGGDPSFTITGWTTGVSANLLTLSSNASVLFGDYLNDGDIIRYKNTTVTTLQIWFNNFDNSYPYLTGEEILLFLTAEDVVKTGSLNSTYKAIVLESSSHWVKVAKPVGWDNTWFFNKIAKANSSVYPQSYVYTINKPVNARENLFWSLHAPGSRYNLTYQVGASIGVATHTNNTVGNVFSNAVNYFSGVQSQDPMFSRLWYLNNNRSDPRIKTRYYNLIPGVSSIHDNISFLVTSDQIQQQISVTFTRTSGNITLGNITPFKFKFPLSAVNIDKKFYTVGKLTTTVIDFNKRLADVGRAHRLSRGIVKIGPIKGFSTARDNITKYGLVSNAFTRYFVRSPIDFDKRYRSRGLIEIPKKQTFINFSEIPNNLKLVDGLSIRVFIGKVDGHVPLLPNMFFDQLVRPKFAIIKDYLEKHNELGNLRWFASQIQDVSAVKKEPITFWS